MFALTMNFARSKKSNDAKCMVRFFCKKSPHTKKKSKQCYVFLCSSLNFPHHYSSIQRHMQKHVHYCHLVLSIVFLCKKIIHIFCLLAAELMNEYKRTSFIKKGKQVYIYIYTGAGHIIKISSKSRFISLIPFKK